MNRPLLPPAPVGPLLLPPAPVGPLLLPPAPVGPLLLPPAPVNPPVVGPSADVPRPRKRERDSGSDFYDNLDVAKKLKFDEEEMRDEKDREFLSMVQRQLEALRTRGDDPEAPMKKPKETNLDTDLDLAVATRFSRFERACGGCREEC